MEVIFSYMSGLGKVIDDILSILNPKSIKYFEGKKYSDEIDKIVFILITQDLTEAEKAALKVKYAKTGQTLAINFYLNSPTIQNEGLNNRLLYIGFVIINSLRRAKRFKKLDLNMDKLIHDLQFFFEVEALHEKYKISILDTAPD